MRECSEKMAGVTKLLELIDSGDPHAAEQLLPLVYDELRQLAAAKLAHEKPGQTLQSTALVHEAYMRLVDKPQHWNSRGHFFGAAAQAMRRILVDQARRKQSQKAGGDKHRIELTVVEPEIQSRPLDLLALDEALEQLAVQDSRACEVVKLRFFAGLTNAQAAEALGVSVGTAENDWAYAKTWLKMRLQESDEIN